MREKGDRKGGSFAEVGGALGWEKIQATDGDGGRREEEVVVETEGGGGGGRDDCSERVVGFPLLLSEGEYGQGGGGSGEHVRGACEDDPGPIRSKRQPRPRPRHPHLHLLLPEAAPSS